MTTAAEHQPLKSHTLSYVSLPDPESTEIGTLKIEGAPQVRKAAQWKKPLSTALFVISAISLVGAGVGLCFWGAGAISHLTQMQAIILTSTAAGTGIVLLIPGIIIAVKSRSRIIVPFSIAVDTSYDRQNNKVIDDRVYINEDFAFACLVDGSGHNNPHMQGPLKSHFDKFIERYTRGLAILSFANLDAFKVFFTAQFTQLETQFNDSSLEENQKNILSDEKQKAWKDNFDGNLETLLGPSNKPTLSFAQVVQCGDQKFLLIAQAGDSMMVYEEKGKLKETLIMNQGTGVGCLLNGGVQIATYNVTGADRVIGFSDGIGEFLTFEEIQKITSNTETDQLFVSIKNKIINAAIPSKNSKNSEERRIIAANNTSKKVLDKTNSGKHDDMSLFVLDLGAEGIKPFVIGNE